VCSIIPRAGLSNVFIYWGASDCWLWRRGRPVAIAIIIVVVVAIIIIIIIIKLILIVILIKIITYFISYDSIS
jgi:hypothetical protein